GKRREPADLHVLPALAAIVAAEEAHAVGQEYGARGSGADGERVAVEHPLDLGLAANAAPVFRLLAETDQIGSAILPSFPAVAAAHRAVGFQCRVDVVRRIGIHVEPHDPAGKPHDHPVGQARIRHLAPGIAAVIAAIDAWGRRTGVDDARVLGVDADRPYISIFRQIEFLPPSAAAGAA